ncbi:putative glucuronosyltransferase [Tetrabaena socialis]|uniref:Putative glucuronosyltransferase n=1 Tax=Tetrabaena socialis TaxID=47790 RepID=A0A2J8A9D0_9CHLO|nr:putative glucuronosyltransferase [Tetrabaena socialis]|eukprot:PNH09138.1 putative glucuronosyltransferase [Tetrabaena socialis]
MNCLLPVLVLLLARRVQSEQPAVIKTALTGLPFNQFQARNAACNGECTQCNRELGECECPFGWGGPSCQVPLLPACRTTLEAGVPVFVGRSTPRNCHCYRQLSAAACLPAGGTQCASHTVSQWGEIRCFEHATQPIAEQLSDLPERLDDPAYRWSKGVVVPGGSGERREFEALPQPPALNTIAFALPLSKCPARHHEPEYSGGVRQALSSLLSNTSHPDVVFKTGGQPIGPGEYEELLGRTRFCLAPYGHGWGIRLTHALMHACVPVIIQDKVRQPFEDLLHYPDFSVRVSKAELPRIVDILRAIPDGDVTRLMKDSARVYRAFIWQPELGGLAYDYTVASLRRRLSHLRGELYEAGTRRR